MENSPASPAAAAANSKFRETQAGQCSKSKVKRNLLSAKATAAGGAEEKKGGAAAAAAAEVLSRKEAKRLVQKVSVDAERKLEERQLHHVRNGHPFMLGEEEEMQEDYDWQVS